MSGRARNLPASDYDVLIRGFLALVAMTLTLTGCGACEGSQGLRWVDGTAQRVNDRSQFFPPVVSGQDATFATQQVQREFGACLLAADRSIAGAAVAAVPGERDLPGDDTLRVIVTLPTGEQFAVARLTSGTTVDTANDEAAASIAAGVAADPNC